MNVLLEKNKKYNLIYFSSLFCKQSRHTQVYLTLMSFCLYTLIPMFAPVYTKSTTIPT